MGHGRLPRLLYIGDVAVADTGAGEALLFRLLQSYPPTDLAVMCEVRPGMPMLPGVPYHRYGAAFPRLLASRISREYCLWHAWKYYRVPTSIANVAADFRAEAILSISHVSAWLAAWQLSIRLGIPLYLIAHDDFVYQDRFPAWAQSWAGRKFCRAYRAARGRFCISEAMAETYGQRFGVPASVIHPTSASSPVAPEVCPHVSRQTASLTFAYGGSINTPAQVDQVVTFARLAGALGHKLLAYTPQYDALRLAADRVPSLEVRQPIHSADLKVRLRNEADCLFLPQSMDEGERALVATAFPTKWADYATMGLPMVVWAPAWSSSARFITDHPGCAELISTSNPMDVETALVRLRNPEHRENLARNLIAVGRSAFSPEVAWQTFRDAVTTR
jgi:Glycosyltransferase Family 4